jgi:glutamate--cysteine ligase
MSDLGYTNKTQAGIAISLNALDEYILDLGAATCTPEPAYECFGVNVDGTYQQLNSNKLQIENEYYSPIRPKRVAKSGERPTTALRRGGIEYVEIRSLDLSIFDPAGINQNTMRFMEAFLVYCLIEESPPFEPGALAESSSNQSLVAKQGREKSLRLRRDGQDIQLVDWAREILTNVSAIAEVIDRSERTESYASAVAEMAARVDDPDQTPSARLLYELRDSGASFFEFALEVARSHKKYFSTIAPLPEQRASELEQETRLSVERQRAIEAADDIDFEEYLARYFDAD